MSNFVCRCPASPTWTNFIPVVKTHQTQADARERRLVGSSVTRQRQDAKSSCPATESGVSSTDIWPVRALHPITRQRRRSCWPRSEEHTSELQSLMRISYAVFCLKNKKQHPTNTTHALQIQKHI